MTAFSTLKFKIEGQVATVTLDRPEARNALNLPMCEELLAASAAIKDDSSVRIAFIRGSGPAFCAGADTKERADKDAAWVRERRMKAFAAYDAFESLAIPVIAVVEGAAMGAGVEICSICDFVIATPEAFFGTPEAQRGTIGATQRLPRIIGRQLAKDMMYTGRRLSAEEAKAFGLVARLVPKDRLEAEIAAVTKAILQAPAGAIRLAKRCIDKGTDTDRKGALAAEIAAIDEQLATGTWLGRKS
jgi:enoyl-CoA hydratase